MAYDLRKALEYAVEVEKEGMRAYMDFALRSTSVDGKNMFIWLAREEYSHMRLFESMLHTVLGGEIPVAEEIPPATVLKFMPRLKKMERADGGSADAHDTDALRAALKMERETRDYYRQQAQAAEDPEVAKVFDALADVEQGHFELIQAQLDYVTQTGFWFGEMEFTVEGRM